MWLLAAEIRQILQQARKNGVVPTAEQQTQFEARYGAYALGDTSRVLTVAGDVAQISITGVMTQAPDFLAMLFGGGNITYPEIIGALAEADANPEIVRAEMRIDSPGGNISGLFDAIAATQAFSKPLRAVVVNQAASAAYALAAQAGEIVASNRAASVGSIGIAASFDVDPDTIDITSSAAPNKRPDVTTEEGRAVVVEYLDSVHELFADAIATGRGVSIEKVNAEFGQGSMLLADAAEKRGMIDAVAGAPLRVVKSAKPTNSASSGADPESTMDLATLKATHPATYALAVAEGQAAERDRVGAHLTLGQACGDMATATAAVLDGSAMTATLQAKYLAAGINRGDQQNRQSDDAAAAAAANNAGGNKDGAETAAEQIAAGLEARFGVPATA